MIPEHRLVHTMTKKSRASLSTDYKGDPVYGAATTFKARAFKMTKRVKNAEGVEVVSTHGFECRTLVKYDDLIWFPAIAGEAADDTTSDNAARTPVSIDSNTDGNGNRPMWIVYF